MNTFYKFIAHLLVETVWLRYGQRIKIATGLGMAALLVGGYLAAKRESPDSGAWRTVPEG